MSLILDIETENITLSLVDKNIGVQKNEEVVKKVPLREVRAVMVSAQNVFFSQSLLRGLTQSNIPFVLLDKNFLPAGVLLPNGENVGKLFDRQAEIKSVLRKKIWQTIVAEKIKNRSKVLCSLNKEDVLFGLENKVLLGDRKNINDKSSDLYYGELFGANFKRAPEACGVNAFLSYCHAQLCLVAMRYIMCSGLNPTLGLNSGRTQNYLALAQDLTEPFQPLADKYVSLIFSRKNVNSKQFLSSEYKTELVRFLNKEYYNGKQLKSLFELIRGTVSNFASSLRKNKADFAFCDYLIEVKDLQKD